VRWCQLNDVLRAVIEAVRHAIAQAPYFPGLNHRHGLRQKLVHDLMDLGFRCLNAFGVEILAQLAKHTISWSFEVACRTSSSVPCCSWPLADVAAQTILQPAKGRRNAPAGEQKDPGPFIAAWADERSRCPAETVSKVLRPAECLANGND
jgi:hypothetical protein